MFLSGLVVVVVVVVRGVIGMTEHGEGGIRDVVRVALKRVKELEEEERLLIRELSESSPNKYMYLGYDPIDIEVRYEQ